MVKKFTLVLIALGFGMLGAFAQSSQPVQSEMVFYVQSADLNVDSYASLHHRVKNDGRFTIATACVPAHILTIKVISPLEIEAGINAAFEDFRQLATQSNLGQVVLLNTFTREQFENACLSARTGN